MWRKGNPSGAAAGASALDVIDHHDDCEAKEYERGDRIGNALQSRIPRVVGPAHGLEHRPYTVRQVEPQRSEPQQIDEDIIPLRERVSDQRSTVGCRDGAAADQRRVSAQDFDELHLRPEVEEMQCQTGQYDESDDQHVFRGPGHARLGDGDGIALLASCAIIVHGENQRECEVHEDAERQHGGAGQCVPVGAQEAADRIVALGRDDRREVHRHVEEDEQHEKCTRDTHHQLLAERGFGQETAHNVFVLVCFVFD